MLQALQKKTEDAGRCAGEKADKSLETEAECRRGRLLNKGALVQMGTLVFWAHQTPKVPTEFTFQEGRPAGNK